MRWHKDGMEARQIDADDYDELCALVTWTHGKAVDDGDAVIELSTADGESVHAKHGDWVIRAYDGQFHVYRNFHWRPLMDGWPPLSGS
jgi:hypothetical protein